MSQVYRGTGEIVEFPGTLASNASAGAMVWLSGGTGQTLQPLTAAVATAVSEASTGFFGVLVADTSGGTTGVRVYRRGVFEFDTVAAATTCAVLVGRPVWGAGPQMVRGFGTTAASITGFHPVGICVALPAGADTSAASVKCWVEIDTMRRCDPLIGESGVAVQ